MDETDDKGFMNGLIDISKGLSWKMYAIGAVTILVLLLIIYWIYFSSSKKENNEVKRKKKSSECNTDDESEQIDKLINEIKEKQNEKEQAVDNSDE
jgi:uncharacterized protein YpmS